MTAQLYEKELNRFLQFIYENFLFFAIGFSIFLFFLWNLTKYILSIVLPDPNQLSLAYTIQDFSNSVLITLLVVFFIIMIQRRELYYFEHLSLMNNGIIRTTSIPYKILYVNQQMIDLLGYLDEEILNKDLSLLFCDEDKIKLAHYFTNPNIPIIKNIEVDLTTKDGTKTPVLISISRTFKVLSKKEKGLFIVVNDIRSLKESQDRYKHLLQVEQESVLNTLVQKVGHEINNPLTFMMYDSDRLIDYVREMIGMLKIYSEVEKKLKHESNPEIVATIDKIEQIKKDMKYETAIDDLEEILTATKDGINRIAKVVKEIRTYPLQESEMHRQSLNNIVKLTVDLVKKYYLKDKENIAIKTQLDINIPLIPLKAGEIAQCLLNTILNSIQAIEERKILDGIIEIETKMLAKTSEDLDQNSLIQLIIKDNGIGIKDHDLERIFQPYFTTKPDGTGLGLSISKKVIEEHNGTIKMESEYSKGTIIKISLPAF